MLHSEPCKFCFCCKIDPKHDRNFIEHNFRHFFKTVHLSSHTRIGHTCTRESAVHASVHTTYLTNKCYHVPFNMLQREDQFRPRYINSHQRHCSVEVAQCFHFIFTSYREKTISFYVTSIHISAIVKYTLHNTIISVSTCYRERTESFFDT